MKNPQYIEPKRTQLATSARNMNRMWQYKLVFSSGVGIYPNPLLCLSFVPIGLRGLAWKDGGYLDFARILMLSIYAAAEWN